MILEDFICSPMISETRKKFVITGLPGSSMIINEPQNITCHPSPNRKAVGSVSPAGSVGAPASQGVPPAHRTPPGTLFSGVGTAKTVPTFSFSGRDSLMIPIIDSIGIFVYNRNRKR